MRTRPKKIRGAIEPSNVLFGKTRRRVLGLLFGHPERTFYLRQIVRQTGSAQGAVQQELEKLTRAGLLLRTVQGRQVHFQANRDAPIFSELQALLLKTAGLVDVLREALAPLQDQIRVAFVFGSAARGELRGDSDIDLFVIGDAPFDVVAPALVISQKRLGRDVNPTVYPPAEFRAKVEDGHHFVTTVLSEPRLFVIGDSNELEGLGTKRLADFSPPERERDPGAAGRRRSRSGRQRS
jgi:predicted nucleotidyltransferase